VVQVVFRSKAAECRFQIVRQQTAAPPLLPVVGVENIHLASDHRGRFARAGRLDAGRQGMTVAHQTKETNARARLLQRGLRLEYLSLGWNVIAGAGAVITGLSTASLALLGFGLDVAIDSLASLILVWRFFQEARGNALSGQAEQKATRAVGVALLAAGLYIAGQAAHSLLTRTASGSSAVGVSIAVLSVCILPPLAYGKIRLASQLNSRALCGDGVLTAVGACLAAVALLGLLVNTFLGWWWADPLAALLITAVLLREGWHALQPTA
jgi:divalent metal cation (Fe/Co/Zn/Cd) transporter